MIEAKNVSKSFSDILAVDNVSVTIKEGAVFGMIGTNGAGKSTFLRMVAGVLKPDAGTISLDGMTVYENPAAKQEFFYISDDQYFFANTTPRELMRYYSVIYPKFDAERMKKMLAQFELDEKRKVATFSKGMKKQLSVICGICANTKYLLCDETFDGLDPVMRQAVKSIFAQEIEERGMTPVIASHNLRELEDICDHVGIMDKGQMLLEKSLASMQGNTVKLQMVGSAPEGLEILHESMSGRLNTLVVRGTPEEVQAKVSACNPTYFDILPLSLEEIFIYELGGVNYEVKNILL